MNYIDLFHGIGGFALGAYWAGMKFENHFCSDIEPYAQNLYALRFPGSVQLGDITKINTDDLKQYGADWIITGGFPCQDISIAGKGVGITGARSGLWFEYWRIIRDLRPRFAIMENVGALTFRGLDAVLGSLSEIGYNAEWQDIRASDLGAPHRRERIWIIAYPDTASNRREWERTNATLEKRLQQRPGDAGKLECGLKRLCENVADTGFEPERDESDRLDNQREYRKAQEFRAEKRDGFTNSSKDVSDNDSQRCKEQYNRITERTGDIDGCDDRRKAEHPGWSTEPDVGRLAHGVSGRVDRLKGLGNAIVPQIAELLFNQIKLYI